MLFSVKKDFRRELEEVYPKLWRFAISVTGSYDTAQDLAQATMVRAMEKSGLYKSDTRLDLWLYKMAHRLWLNELRARKIRTVAGVIAIEDAHISDQKPDQVSNIFYGEVLDKVMALPEGQRMVVFLVYVEGHKYAEAADLLGIPIGTVMSRLAAARKTLIDRLADSKDGAL